MHKNLLAAAAILMAFLAASAHAQQYAIDPSHTSVTFQASHLGLSWTHGRFNKTEGEFFINRQEPEQSTFSLTIQAESIDTANQQRDDHLRGPDFFNVRQFPLITFQSSEVAAVENGYEVKGDLTLHGETKPVEFRMVGGRTAEFPRGVHRTGFSTSLKIKRSEFGMDGMQQAIGDEVNIVISFEGIQK